MLSYPLARRLENPAMIAAIVSVSVVGPFLPFDIRAVVFLPVVMALFVAMSIDLRYGGTTVSIGAVGIGLCLAALSITESADPARSLDLVFATVPVMGILIHEWMRRVGFGRTLRMVVPMVLSALACLPSPDAIMAAAATIMMCGIRELRWVRQRA